MAPKGTKGKRAASPGRRAASPGRARATSDARNPKRTRHGKCNVVDAAIREVPSDHLSESMRELLHSVIPSSLAVYKDQRHPFQAAAVGQIQQVLHAARTRHEAAVVEAQSSVDHADGDRAQRTQDMTDAEEAVPKLESAAAAAKGALAQAAVDLKAADKTFRGAEITQREADASIEVVEAEHTKVEALLAEPSNGPLKLKILTSQEKSTLLSYGKKLGADGSLLGVLPQVFRKEPGQYGRFDLVALEHVEEAVGAHKAGLAKQLADAAPERAARAATVATAQRDLVAAEEHKAASIEAVAEARKALAAGVEALKQSKIAVDRFLHDLKARADTLDIAKRDLEEFIGGAVASFNELRDLESTPPAAPPAPAPAAPTPPRAQAAAPASPVKVNSPAKSPRKSPRAKPAEMADSSGLPQVL